MRPNEMPALQAGSSDSAGNIEASARQAKIEAILAKAKLEVIPDGEKFVWIVPAGLGNSPVLKGFTHISRPKTRGATAEISGSLIPTGTVDFLNTPVQQVLSVYSELRNRTLLYPASLPSPAISLYTQAPLTKDELNYALNVVLALNGLAAVDDGERFVQVVPLQQVGEVRVEAPKSKKNEVLIDPATVPRFSERSSLPKVPGTAQEPNQATALPPIADSLLSFYAGLTGRKAIPGGKLGRLPVRFDVRNHLTKAEMLYATETTLRLNGLVIVSDEPGSLQLQAIAAE
ncbi:MAG: hypothetical protein ACTHLW_03005 [Verrucomicrobiota bacterium]